MLTVPDLATDDARARRLIEQHPWALVVADADGTPLASHVPVIVDPDADELTLLSHVGAQDPIVEALRRGPALVIVQGPHAYVSPTWYGGGTYVPSWNFEVVHLWGQAEEVTGDASHRVLDLTCAHLEGLVGSDWRMAQVDEYARRLVGYVTSFRLRPTRVQTRSKLAQDKPLPIRHHVIDELRRRGSTGELELANAMEGALGQSIDS